MSEIEPLRQIADIIGKEYLAAPFYFNGVFSVFLS